jgi:hypothetical protein
VSAAEATPVRAAPARSTAARMLAAFAYLRAMTLANLVRQRIKRLRQPKYLFGALAAGAYFYFFFFRQVLRAGAHGRGLPGAVPPELWVQLPALVAVGLLVVVAAAWLLPGDRAALAFSEAEVAFLFPAPLSRVALINFSLLRAQLAIFASAFIMTLLFGRGRMLPGSTWQHATALWLLMATLRLHFLGASFAHDRLIDTGIRPLYRWLASLAAAALLVALAGWWLGTHVRAPVAADFDGALSLTAWFGAIVATPPVSWVLAPFRLLAEPMFARDTTAWLHALWPALGLLALHYGWVLRSHVAFEEASMDRARRRAEKRQAMQSGKAVFRLAPAGPRKPAFALAPTGAAPVAFLWRGLIAAGPMFRPRYALLVLLVALAGTQWLAHSPTWHPLLKVVAMVAAMLSSWLFVVGPMLVQRGLRETLEQLDIFKAAPLRGWQIALGQLLTPVALITAVQWLLLLVAARGFAAGDAAFVGGHANLWAGAVAVALVAPALCALMLCLPFAGLLYFPAWASASGGRGGGFEVIGQRMLFMGGYLLALVAALFPVVVIAGGAFALVAWLGAPLPAIALAALLALAVLGVELAFAVLWLGRRIDRFDVSQELR